MNNEALPMISGKHNYWPILCGLTLWISGCSSGAGEAPGQVSSAVQDLTLDPDGRTTTIIFSRAPGPLLAANFSASGGQTVLSVSSTGNTAAVVWDQRVSPLHQVSISGIGGFTGGISSVGTSDNSVPSFTISAANMQASGGDTLEVTFSGPRVVEVDAEDPANWSLSISSTQLDLAGSTFALDPVTQVMDITLGASASLHANFNLAADALTSVADVSLSTSPVVGSASGDSAAPLLDSVVQNLGDDEFGRTVDFTFDEAMDSTFSVLASNFQAPSNTATSASQPSAGLLRVTFVNPVIPGVDQVTLSNMMDTHGNLAASGAQIVTQPAPASNAFSTLNAVTVSNLLGDHILADFDQAFDPSSAENAASWTLVVDGVARVLLDQALSYDFAAKSLRINLDFDMLNDDLFSLTGNTVLEVDGELFSGVTNGVVAGDILAPTILEVLQNRVQDPSGQTLDVTFSEDLDGAAVGVLGNWTVGSLTVSTATLLGTPRIVRLTLTGGPAVPGLFNLGASGQTDLAGNTMAIAAGEVITSTDNTAPGLSASSSSAPAGANNDSVLVHFNEDMVGSGVETSSYWSLESPLGTPIDLTGASIVYNDVTRRATLTLSNPANGFFKGGDDYSVTLTTMTDISGNALAAGSATGTVTGEEVRPYAHGALSDFDPVVPTATVYFSEHMDLLDDLYDAASNTDGARYMVRDNTGSLRGLPTSATVLDDGLGVQLGFGFVLNSGDTIDVMGATDLVGNFAFPALALPLGAEDLLEPGLAPLGSSLVAVSGVRNDTVQVVFDRGMNPWGIEDPAHYSLTTGGNPVDFSGARIVFDGVDTVDITFESPNSPSLQSSSLYDLQVDGLSSSQGVAMTVPSLEAGIAVSGDITAPLIGAGNVLVDPAVSNSMLVFADEPLDPTTAEDTTRWNWAHDSPPVAEFPTQATLISPSVLRLTFVSTVIGGQTLNYQILDLAGNQAAANFDTVLAADQAHPILVSARGTAVAGSGGDYITVVFNEPVDPWTALDAVNYTVTNGTNPVSVSGAGGWYNSLGLSANLFLTPGDEFDTNQAVTITVLNVSDHSGNVIPVPFSLGGTVGGDNTPPTALTAFTNYRIDPTGLLVDVLFSEALAPGFVGNQFNWQVTGGSSHVVLGLLPQVDENVWRVVLSGPLGNGEELSILPGLADLAGNAALLATPVDVTE
jgi:hypothetical protein